MIADHFQSVIKQNLGHIPTAGQEKLITLLIDFILNRESERIFVVKGFAGTGKTTVISAFVKTLEEMGMKTLLLAPTGRAAKVFSGYAGKPAFTIHRKIYRQQSSADGFGNFVLNKNLQTNLIILVDEASMISDTLTEGSVFGSGRLLADLLSFINDSRNGKVVFIGDTAQLPPIGIVLSPALDRNELSLYMRVAGEFQLTDIVRQNRDSGILINATSIRNQISSDVFSEPSLFETPDVRFISGNELIDAMERAYSRHGTDEVIVLCRSNKKSNQYNAGIRKNLLFREEDLTSGDLLMVVKNNYYWLRNQPDLDFIANGDIIRIKKIRKFTERYGFRFAFALIELIDYGIEVDAWILLDAIISDTSSLGSEDNRKLFYSVLEDYNHLETRSKQYKAVKEDDFFNALQVKYAYAVTCHKAQGGQWKAVFIDQGYITSEKIDLEYLRWLYTAVTRASEELYFVNFPKDWIKKTV